MMGSVWSVIKDLKAVHQQAEKTKKKEDGKIAFSAKLDLAL